MAVIKNTRDIGLQSRGVDSRIMNPRINMLVSSSPSGYSYFSKAPNTSTLVPASITLTADTSGSGNYNAAGYNWEYSTSADPVTWISLGTTTAALTITNTNFVTYAGTGNFVNFRVTVTQAGWPSIKQIWVVDYYRADAVVPVVSLSRSDLILPVSTTGVINYTSTNTDIRVSINNVYIPYDVAGTAGPNTFTVTAVGSTTPNTVTPGTATTTTTLVANDTRSFGNIAGMSATVSPGNIVYTITVRDVDGIVSTFTRTQSVVVSLTGANAKILSITADSYVFKADANNALISSTIKLTANKQNTANTVTWSLSPSIPLYTAATGGSVTTTGDTVYLRSTDFGANSSTIITATIAADSLTDTCSVLRVKDGSSAVTAVLSNPLAPLSTTAANVVTYTGSGTTIEVYEGSTLRTITAVSPAATNITVGAISGLNSTTVTYADHSAITQDNAKIIYTITFTKGDGTSGTATVTQSLTKSKAGSNGTSPLVYEIVTSAPVIIKDAPDSATSGVHSSIAIQGKKYDGSTTTNYGWVTVTANGATEATTATDTASAVFNLSPGNADAKTSYTIKMYNQQAIAGATLLDTKVITVLFKGATGINALSAVLSNESHVFPANTVGTVGSYTSSGTDIYVFEGATALTYDGLGTSNSTWKVVVTTATNITAGAFVDNGTYASTAVHSGVADAIDTSSILYTITGKNSLGTAFSLTKTQSFSKSKAGTPGTNGISVFVATIYQQSATAPATPVATASSYNFANNTLTPPAGWSTTQPATTTTPTYACNYTFSGTAGSTVTGTGSWSTPYIEAVNGTNGEYRDTIQLYLASATAPTAPTSVLYTFTGNVLGTVTGGTAGWTMTQPPTTTTPTYITKALASTTTPGTAVTLTGWSTPAIVAQSGTNGTSVFVATVYQQSATAPATPVATASSYNFANNTLTPPAGWSTTQPATTTTPTYACDYTFSGTVGSTVTGTGSWSTPYIEAVKGADGTNGEYRDIIQLYLASATVPTAPTSVLYTFTDNILGTVTGGTAGWSMTQPATTTTPTYIIKALASTTTPGTAVTLTSWSTPAIVAQSGTNGTSVFIATVYQQSATVPATPVATASSYNFANNTLTPPAGWSITQQDTTTTPTYACNYTFSGTAGSTVTGTGSWSTPYIEAVNGINGEYRDTIQLYLASATAPTAPTSVLYTFTGNALGTVTGGTAGWTMTQPPTTTTPTYITKALASTTTPGTAITLTGWSTPAIVAQSGTNGTSPLVYEIVTSAPIIVKDAPDSATSGTHSSITIQGRKYDGSTTSNYGWVTVTANGATEATTATDTASAVFTLSPGNADAKTSYTIKLYNQPAVSGATILDTKVVSIVFKGATGANGANAISATVNNDSHVFPAGTTGAVSSYVASGTDIYVFEGATALTYDGIGTSNGTWKVVVTTATNITAGAISDSGSYATVAAHSAVADAIDTSSILYTITGKSSAGTAFSLTKQQTFSKSKTGTPGAPGTSGDKFITVSAFKWATGTAPTATGTGTFTWSTKTYNNPPTTWTPAAESAPDTGYTLYQVNLVVSDVATATTTAIDWANGTIGTIGYRQDGSVGQTGDSHRTAYIVTTSSSAPTSVTTNPGGDLPPSNTVSGQLIGWSFSAPTSTTLNALAAGWYMYQVDGIYTNGQLITWGNPYLSNLKVASLSAISADLGVVGISSTGRLASTGKTYANATAGFFLGYDTTTYKFDVGNSTSYLRWTGSALETTGITIKDGAGNVLLSSGATLATSSLNIPGTVTNVPAGWQNSNVSLGTLGYTGDTNATYGAVSGITLKDSNGRTVNDLKLLGNVIDSTTWVENTSGTQVGFTQNSTSSTGSNAIIYSDLPSGGRGLVWRATSGTATSLNAEGGWDGTTFNVNPIKSYRFSVWVRLSGVTPASGNLYLGVQANSVNYINNSLVVSNPYFITTSRSTLPTNEWLLIVGYVYGSGYASTTNPQASGIYSSNTGQKLVSGTDFKWVAPKSTYVTKKLASTTTPGTAVTLTGWSTPTIIAQSGTSGNSLFVATVYRQSATAPATPVATASSYNFATNTLTPPTDWSITQPATTTTPTYACDYTFSGPPGSTVVGTGSWSTPYIEAVNNSGGQYIDTIQLYLSSDTVPTAPTSVPYTFTGNVLGTITGGTAGWSRTVPAAPTIPTSLLRTYQFYTTAAGNIQDFWGPRAEMLDGSEPTLSQLLSMGSISARNQLTGTNASTFIADAAIQNAQIGGDIYSSNYFSSGGASGWYLNRAGDIIANSGTFRGSLSGANITGATGTFSGNLQAGSVDFASSVGTTTTITTAGWSYVTNPVNNTKLRITAYGGGGGGGGGGWQAGYITGWAGYGGSAGSLVTNVITLTGGETIQIYIGAGGAGGGFNAAGSTGQTTLVYVGGTTQGAGGTLVFSATGGVGGATGYTGNQNYIYYSYDRYSGGDNGTTLPAGYYNDYKSYNGQPGNTFSLGGGSGSVDANQNNAAATPAIVGTNAQGGGGGSASAYWIRYTSGAAGSPGKAVIETYDPNGVILRQAFDTLKTEIRNATSFPISLS